MGIGDFTKAKSPIQARSAESREERRARRQNTGPKTMATAQLMSMNELDEANAKLEQYEGSLPVRELDPNRVRVSKFANRHESHFVSAAFGALREDIISCGGNTVPIMVRPVNDSADADYEVIFGHRRLQACRDAALSVRALIQDATDQELYAMMIRENNAREDLSAYEEAVSYKKALDEGLYPTQQALAAAIGVTQGRISQVLSLTKVPATVMALFSSPVKVQYRWAMEIVDLLNSRRADVMATAKSLKGQRAQLTDRQIFDALISKSPPTKIGVKVDGKTKATIVTDANIVKVAFAKYALTASQTEALAGVLESFLTDNEP